MPKQGRSDAEWKARLREYANGAFKFGQGQRPPKTSKWATDISLIDKCPVNRATKTLFGDRILCKCGYHNCTATTPGKPVLKTTSTKPIEEPIHVQPQNVNSTTGVPTEKHPSREHSSLLNEKDPLGLPESDCSSSTPTLTDHNSAEKMPSNSTPPVVIHFEKTRKNDYSLRLPEGWKTTLELGDQQWIGKDLFSSKGVLVVQLKNWWYPPQPPGPNSKSTPLVESYYYRRLFLWMPRRMWTFDFKCPVCKPLTSLTPKGLYNRVRSVIDLTNKYYLAAEYLECRSCKGTFISYDSRLLEELPVDLKSRFPIVMTRKFACDRSVVTLMRGRTFGNSPTGVCNTVKEIHSEEWMRNTIAYLSDCKRQHTSREHLGLEAVAYPSPPLYKSRPTPKWFLAVYVRDVWSRLPLLKASATSVYGTILKIDSTKKITRKLQGASAKSVSWCSNIGNEKGEVLISILTTSESLSNLQTLAEGLMDRYEKAQQPPPLVLYTDRDCCKDDGQSNVSNESHPLYGFYMAKVSAAIFEWDVDDVKLLLEAKKSELQIAGISNPSPETVRRATTKNELARHCRRKTRGTNNTIALLEELIASLTGITDSLGVPLLREDVLDVWAVEKKHVSCLQDPDNMSLYTKTGDLTKGRIQLPIYRCGRGTTSLESFHLHVNNFIPGTAANDMHFQAFLIDGLCRWNAARASASFDTLSPFRTFDIRLQDKMHCLSKDILGSPIDPLYHPPSTHTGELFGIEYLYFESEKDDRKDISLNEVELSIEEGMDSDEELIPSDYFQGDTDVDTEMDLSFEAFMNPEDSSDIEDIAADCNSIAGWDKVDNLAACLVGCNYGLSLKQSEADVIVRLYEDLAEYDKRPLKFDRHARPSKGRFARTREKCNGSHVKVDAMKRCFLTGGAPSHSPSKSRLVDAICSRLCIKIVSGEKNPYVSRFAKIIQHYNVIRERVMNNKSILERTGMALYPINETTLTNWYKKKTRSGEIKLLLQGVTLPSTSFCSTEELPPAMQPRLSSSQVGHNPYSFIEPFDATGLANVRMKDVSSNSKISVNEKQISNNQLVFPATPVIFKESIDTTGQANVRRRLEFVPVSSLPLEEVVLDPFTGPKNEDVNEPSTTPTSLSRTTLWRKRKAAVEQDGGLSNGKPVQKRKEYSCTKCHKAMTSPGHTQFKGKRFCSVSEQKSKEQWLAEMRSVRLASE